MSKKIGFGIILVIVLAIGIVGFWKWNEGQETSAVPEDRNINKKKPEAGDHLFNLQGGYAYFGDHAYYEGKLLEGADGSEFESLGYSGYGKDKSKVYYEGFLIEDADAETFKELESFSRIFADKSQAYYRGEKMNFSEAEELNNFLTKNIGGVDLGNYYKSYDGKVYFWLDGPHAPSTMSLIDADPTQFTTFTSKYCTNELIYGKFNGCTRYGKDNKKVFMRDFEIKGADPETFTLLGKEYWSDTYSRDKDSVFHGIYELQSVDPDSFVMISNDFGKDKNRVFYGEKEIFGADPNTFKILDPGGLSRDKENFFSREEKIDPKSYETFGVNKYLK